jgi:acyl-CoA thioesterase
MPTAFSDLLANTRREGSRVAGVVGEDWLQGRSLFGGLQVALALYAMRGAAPDLPLRVLQTTFIAPVPAGQVDVEARLLRTGKSTRHVEARVLVGGETCALVIGIFGASRSSAVKVSPSQPAVPPGPSYLLPRAPGLVPNFTQHFTARWIRGTPPYTGERACTTWWRSRCTIAGRPASSTCRRSPT